MAMSIEIRTFGHSGIRSFLCFAFSLVSLLSSSASESYVGAAGMLTLPQGGKAMHRVGGAVARAGTYLADPFAIEAEAGALENTAVLSATALFHLNGIEYYDYLFGFSKLDPFVSAGARGWIGREGDVGPKAGAGAYYHLTDNWSLRGDADATLGLDGGTGMLYSLSLGLICFF